jgi:hypothetical protein
MIVECANCNAYVEADEISNFQYPSKNGKPSGRFVFLKCKNCDNPILIEQENIGNVADGDIFDKPIVVYPKEENKDDSGIPKKIKNSLNEATSCYKANSFTATAIMCRRVLEGICTIKEFKTKNLMSSIEKMKDHGIIDNQLFQWADILRITGNEAAHDINVDITKEDAKDMLEFTNAMAEYIFMFKDKLENFKKRRGKSD